MLSLRCKTSFKIEKIKIRLQVQKPRKCSRKSVPGNTQKCSRKSVPGNTQTCSRKRVPAKVFPQKCSREHTKVFPQKCSRSVPAKVFPQKCSREHTKVFPQKCYREHTKVRTADGGPCTAQHSQPTKYRFTYQCVIKIKSHTALEIPL